MSAAKVFLDSNVVLYTVDYDTPDKQELATTLIGGLLMQHRAVVSYQVVQEYFNTCLRKFPKQAAGPDALRYANEVLWPICEVLPSPLLMERGLRLHTRYSYSYYDSLILSAALEARCGTLYSEDLQHGQKIEGVEIINPFLELAASKPKKASAAKRAKP